MALQRSPVAGPHPSGLPPPLQRVGALLWWRFIEAATAPSVLAGSARRAGFPALFLPVPFPVSDSVAFQRALRRATASVPEKIGGQWSADGVPLAGREPAEVLRELGVEPKGLGVRPGERARGGGVAVAQVLELDRKSPERPWGSRIVCVLDLGTGKLRLRNVSAAAGTRRLGLMRKRIRDMYQEELTLATYPEIGDGVMEALEDVGGVKLRPGLYSVPGQAGIDRADAAVEYLRTIGSTRAGIMDLYDGPQAAPAPESLVQLALHEAIEALADELDPATLEAMKTRALRTQWERIEGLEERVETNRPILGPAAGELVQRLEPLRRRVGDVALDKKIVLERPARPAAVRRLRKALDALRRAARARDRAALDRARRGLAGAQPAALAGGFAPLLRRLRKLADAADRVQDQALYPSLAEAVDFVEERARAVYSGPYDEAP